MIKELFVSYEYFDTNGLNKKDWVVVEVQEGDTSAEALDELEDLMQYKVGMSFNILNASSI